MIHKFELGQQVMTCGVNEWMAGPNLAISRGVFDALRRHAAGDWGDVGPDDWAANDYDLEHGHRLLSSYMIEGTKIWIITEADRSVTTILFPDEY